MQRKAASTSKLIIILALSLSCSNYSRTSEGGPNIAVTPSDSARSSKKPASQEAGLLCSRISQIKVLPLKGERGEDPIYDAFKEAGEFALPCLIEKVTDTTEMRDPRPEPRYPGITTKVGDIAYFVLVDITKLDFTEALPPDVQQEYKEEGVYAYFKYVQTNEHRKTLQANLYKWYQEKYGKDPRNSAQQLPK
jgi:hypothetical protein